MGYCEACGSALDPVARNCVRCGALAPVSVGASEAGGTVWAPPLAPPGEAEPQPSLHWMNAHYPMPNFPLDPRLPRFLWRRWVRIALPLGLVVVRGAAFVIARRDSERPHSPAQGPARADKPITLADYVNGGGITYHAPNGDYSIALPSEPAAPAGTATAKIDDVTITVTERDLGPSVPREALARVKELQDVTTLVAGFDASRLHVDARDGVLIAGWANSEWGIGDRGNTSSFEMDRALLIGSHFFVLSVKRASDGQAVFNRLVDSFAPSPALSSF